jgi:hypothetical protein
MQTNAIAVLRCLDRVLKVAMAVILFASANFGLSLFFSTNHDILNPEVHLWPVAIKDGAWIALVGVLVLMRLVIGPLKPGWPWVGTAIWLTALGCLIATGIALLLRDGTHLDVNYVRSLKNYFFYQLLPYLFIFLAPSHWNIRKVLFWSMVSALAISCSVYGLEASYKPGTAGDPRMYGSMGNPNAVGLVAGIVMLFLLADWEETPLVLRLAIAMLVWAATLFSASISAMMILSVILLWKVAETTYVNGPKAATLLVAQITAMFGLALLGAYLMFGIETPFLMRIASLMELLKIGSVFGMDSVAVRIQAWQGMGLSDRTRAAGQYVQYDSAVQTFATNYSLAGMVMICLPMLMIGWGLRNRSRRSIVFAKGLQLEFFGCVVIFLLSGLLQYQMSHFPTNLLFNLTVALLVREVVISSAGKKEEPVSGHAIDALNGAK